MARARIERGVVLLLKGVASLVVAVVVASYLVPLPPSPDRDPSSFLPPSARLVTVDGERTAVVEAGPPDGPSVVLIHGFGGSTFSWRLTIPALAAAGYHAVALDLVDFGLSDKRWDVDTSHAAQARFVVAVMDRLGVDRAVIVGHSMGANVAVRIAMDDPGRVAGLVLVDAAVIAPGITPPGGSGGPLASIAGSALRFPPFLQVARQLVRRAMTEDRVVAILRSAYADPASVAPDVVDGYLAQVRTRDWDLALLAVGRDGGRNELPAPLSSITLPSLVIWGERDPWIPRTTGEAIRDAIPGAVWSAIPGAGHLPFEERPDAFMAALLPFLAGIRGAPASG